MRGNILILGMLDGYVAGRKPFGPAQGNMVFRPTSLIAFTHDPEYPLRKRNSRPEKIFMVGPCRVSIFRNVVLKDGKEIEIPKVVLEVRYKDKQGRWQGTQGITLREIPKAILALQKAFEYLTDNSGERSERG